MPGLGRHQVEHVAQTLQRGGDVVQIAEVLAGLVQLMGQPEPLLHGGDRHPVDGVAGGHGVQLAQSVVTRASRAS